MPSNASAKSEAVPYNIDAVLFNVIVPETASLISFNLATLTLLVTVTLPVYSVTVPAKAACKSEAVPDRPALVSLSTIAPDVSALIALSCAAVTVLEIVTA